jgi:hypothetical protein
LISFSEYGYALYYDGEFQVVVESNGEVRLRDRTRYENW